MAPSRGQLGPLSPAELEAVLEEFDKQKEKADERLADGACPYNVNDIFTHDEFTPLLQLRRKNEAARVCCLGGPYTCCAQLTMGETALTQSPLSWAPAFTRARSPALSALSPGGLTTICRPSRLEALAVCRLPDLALAVHVAGARRDPPLWG